MNTTVMQWRALACAALTCLSAAAWAEAATAVFQEGVNGYVGTADTFLMSGVPDAVQGASTAVEWDGSDAGGQNFALVQFDNIFGTGAGQIPPGSIIDSATFAYGVFNAGNTGTVNEVLVSWDESVSYNTFGGDAGIQADEYGAEVGSASGTTGEQSVDVTSSVAAWSASPTSNHGWIIRPTGGTDGVQFYSSEYATSAYHPRLTVTYTPLTTDVVISPDQLDAVVGSADVPVTVTIPPDSNQSVDVHVTLTTDDAGVAVPVGATGNALTITFLAGASSQQTVDIDIGAAGSATITTTNDAGLGNATLTVDVTAGAVAFSPASVRAMESWDMPVRVSISPGANDTRAVAVTLTTDNAAVAVPVGATGNSLVVNFAAGAPTETEQSVTLDIGQVGTATITTTNDGGLVNATLPVEVNTGFMFTATADNRNLPGFTDVLAAINTTGGPGVFMPIPGDFDPPDMTDQNLDAAFGAGFDWYPVVGNHETETPSDMVWVRNEFSNLPYIVNTGPPGSEDTTYSFDYGDAHFVAVNEYADGVSCDTCLDGDIATAMYNWIATDLAATDKKWIFVLGHEPAYPQPDAYWGDSRHVGDSLDKYPTRRDAFWALLDAYDVVAYMCGHTHRYSRYLQDGVWQLDCGEARDAGQYGTYVRIFVERDSVTFDVYRSLGTGTFSLFDTWSVDRPTFAPSDFDEDGDVDLTDYGYFLGCYNGPNQTPAQPNCDPPDFDEDNDVDLTDYGVFLGCYNGPNNPPACAF